METQSTRSKPRKLPAGLHCDNSAHKTSTVSTICSIKSCKSRFLCDRCVKDPTHSAHRKYFQPVDYYFRKDKSKKTKPSDEAEEKIKIDDAQSIIPNKKDMIKSFLIEIADEYQTLEDKMNKLLDEMNSLFETMKKDMQSNMRKRKRDFTNMFNLFQFFLSREPNSKLTPNIHDYDVADTKDLMDILLYLDDNQMNGNNIVTPFGEFSTDYTVLQTQLMSLLHSKAMNFEDEAKGLKNIESEIMNLSKKCISKIEHKKFVRESQKMNMKSDLKEKEKKAMEIETVKKVKKDQSQVLSVASTPIKGHPYRIELPLSTPSKRKKVDSIELIKQNKQIEMFGAPIINPNLANYNPQAVGFSLRREGSLSSKTGKDFTEEDFYIIEELKRYFDMRLGTALILKQQITILSYVNDNKILVGYTTGLIEYWNLKSNLLLGQFFGHQKAVRGLKMLKGGKLMASSASDNTIRIWEVASMVCTSVLYGHTDTVHCFITVENDSLLISGSEDKTIKLWNVDNGECRSATKNNSGTGIYSLCELPLASLSVLSKAGSLPQLNEGEAFLFAAGSRSTVNIWVYFLKFKRDPEIVATLKGHEKNIKKIICWDKSTLVSCSVDTTIKIWNLRTESIMRSINAHSSLINSISAYENNMAIVSVGNDGNIKFWDPITGQKISEINQGPDAIFTLASVEDGRVITAGVDKVVRVWNNIALR